MSRTLWVLVGLLGVVVLAVIWSISAGAVPISASVIVNTLFGLEGPHQDFIILQSRLPRTVLALIAGAALAISGAIIQALLRNPLASPKVIGINSGAALAVCLGVLSGVSPLWSPVLAAVGGFAAASLVWIGSLRRGASPARLALIGIAVGFLADAGVDYILVTAPTFEFSAPLVWLTGSLWSRGWDDVARSAPLILPLIGMALLLAFRLDLIRLGDAHARGLGMNVKIERFLLLALATALASVSVAAVGALGFVGLMAPHMARQLVGGNHRAVLPASMLVGMALVVLSDAAGRALAPPIEISAGILTALFGAPFFVFILLTSRREGL
ncbi:FecCD family ABC transporter permease [Falsihalocynthiibacter sp. S25ZX9]|uniref:FecCD family ABC transporter permease n=1 Tax=Falsihalocynthiibacter sp. S25ZX9 TaxID=3240870 RepID=UPI00350F5EFC